VQSHSQNAKMEPSGESGRIEPGLPPLGSATTRSERSTRSADDTLAEVFKNDALALRNRYLLDVVLAVGSTAIVYKARDVRKTAQHFGRTVAIKALRPELHDNANAIEQLKREFRLAAALNHPNIVRMFDLEQTSGCWFISMEYLQGQSLATLLYNTRPRRLPLAQTRAILHASNAALAFAHRNGVLHCDFKPDNVWLTAAHDVRIIDFGAAQSCPALASQKLDNRATSDECAPRRCATPLYASPQVLAGEPHEQRDDVFSFACMAYELLAGQPPFGRLNVVEMHAAGIPLTRLAGIPWRSWRVLKLALQWDPAHRTTGMQAAFDSLNHSLDHSLNHAATSVGVAALEATTRRALAARAACGAYAGSLVKTAQWRGHLPNVLQPLAAVRAQLRVTTQRFSLLASQIEWLACRTAAALLIAVRSTCTFLAAAAPTASRWQQRHRASLRRRLELAVLDLPHVAIGAAGLILASLVFFYREPASLQSSDAMAASASGSAETARSPSARPLAPQNVSLIAPTPIAWTPNAGRPSHDFDWQMPSFVATTFSIVPRTSTMGVSMSLAQPRSTIRPRASVALEQATVEVSEQAVAAVLVLKRVGSTYGAVNVRWRTIVGSAKPETDYQSVASGIARFADNQSIRALYVQLKENRLAQSNRSFEVELSTPSSGAVLGQIRRAVVTIQKAEQHKQSIAALNDQVSAN